MKITKREMIIAGVAILVIIIVIAVAWMHDATAPNPTQEPVATPETSAFLHGSATTTSSGVPLVTAVPANTVVPNATSTDVSADVAVPVVQGPGDLSGSVSYRSFNINITGGKYSPNTVIVKQGDTVNLELTAVDADYGFTLPTRGYGFNVSIPQGKTQQVQFEASLTGNFLFYCASCGGPSAGPTGHLIVTAN